MITTNKQTNKLFFLSLIVCFLFKKIFLEILWKHDYDSAENCILDERLNSHQESDDDNNNDDDDDKDSNNDESNQENSVESKKSKSLASSSPKPLENDWLTKIPFIEGVLLKIYPTYYNGVLLKPKVLLLLHIIYFITKK